MEFHRHWEAYTCLLSCSFAVRDHLSAPERAHQFGILVDDDFLRRTPDPPPFSSINSTPADFSAAQISSPVLLRPPKGPSRDSKRFIVGTDTPEASASSS